MEKQYNSTPDLNNNRPDPERLEPDTQKVVQRHLQDESHEITEEEIENIKISTDHIHKDFDNLPFSDAAASKSTDPGHTNLDDKVVTPWDVTT
jgi:hypothetical protein